jgi:hypothetical protein
MARRQTPVLPGEADEKNLVRGIDTRMKTFHEYVWLRMPAMRSLPLFPELSATLRRLQASRPAPRGRVVLGYSSESNLGGPMSRIIADAGITDFGRPFLNLRSTRSTELAEKGIPIQDFCRWLGHTPKVALEFYMQVRSASYDRAAASIVTVDPSTLRSA